MQGTQDLRVSKDRLDPCPSRADRWVGEPVTILTSIMGVTQVARKPIAEKLSLFRVSRTELINVMLKSTDCDSQKLMQWVMWVGGGEGRRRRRELAHMISTQSSRIQ